jgi:hypothetical protein
MNSFDFEEHFDDEHAYNIYELLYITNFLFSFYCNKPIDLPAVDEYFFSLNDEYNFRLKWHIALIDGWFFVLIWDSDKINYYPNLEELIENARWDELVYGWLREKEISAFETLTNGLIASTKVRPVIFAKEIYRAINGIDRQLFSEVYSKEFPEAQLNILKNLSSHI